MRTRKRPYTAKGKPGRVRTRPGFAVQEGFLGAGRGAAGKGPRTRGITMPVIPSPTRTRVSAVMKINPYNGRGGSPCPPEHSQIRTHGLAAMKPKVRCNPFLPLTGAVAEAPPVAEKARRGRRSAAGGGKSEARAAKRSKFAVRSKPANFGHRERAKGGTRTARDGGRDKSDTSPPLCGLTSNRGENLLAVRKNGA